MLYSPPPRPWPAPRAVGGAAPTRLSPSRKNIEFYRFCRIGGPAFRRSGLPPGDVETEGGGPRVKPAAAGSRSLVDEASTGQAASIRTH